MQAPRACRIFFSPDSQRLRSIISKRNVCLDGPALFAVTRRSFSVHNLPGRAVIENLARRLYALLKSNDQLSGDEIDRLAADLSRILLEPVAREIRGKHLLIVADGGASVHTV
jgi:hypothetical protein